MNVFTQIALKEKSGAENAPHLGTVLVQTLQSGTIFYQTRLIDKRNWTSIGLVSFYKTPFFSQTWLLRKKNGSTLQSGTVFQNGSRVEPFWLHIFFSEGHSMWDPVGGCNGKKISWGVPQKNNLCRSSPLKYFFADHTTYFYFFPNSVPLRISNGIALRMKHITCITEI